jgi:hypothetical protein
MNTLDFDDDSQLKSAFAEAARASVPPAGLKETVRKRLFSRPATPAASPRPRARWRRIRTLAAGALAASLLVAALLWLSRPETELVSVAYAELGEVLQNSDQAEWVHYFEKDGREIWMSFRPHRSYSKYASGACAMDRSTNREYWYDAAKGTLTVSFMGLPSGHSWDQYASLSEYMREFVRMKIEHFELSGGEVRKGTDTLDGKTVTVYVVTASDRGVKGTLKYYVDPQTDLLVGAEIAAAGLPGQRLVIDYPAKGPQSVYELGVPRDVKIVDKTPPQEVLDLVERVEAAAKAAAKQSYHVSAQVYQSFSEQCPPWVGATVNVTYSKDGQVRKDEYNVRCPQTLSRQQALEYLETLRKQIPVDRLEALDAWLSDRKPEKIFLADMQNGRGTFYGLDEEGKLASQPISPAMIAIWKSGSPVELDDRPSLLPEQEGQWGKLVGIQNHDGPKLQRWYFNPDRDYVCEKAEVEHSSVHESWPGKTNSRQVLEYAKTPGGRWFRKRLRRLEHGGRETILITNFQDDRRGIEPGVFDGSRITARDLSFRP